MYHPCRADRLRQNGCDCRPSHTQMQHEDKHRIQTDIQDRSDQYRQHRRLRFSLSTDVGIQPKCQLYKDRSDQIDRYVISCIDNRCITCSECIKDWCLTYRKERRQNHRKKDQQSCRIAKDLLRSLFILFSKLD